MKNQVDALIRELSAGQDDEVVGHVVELTSVLSDADRELLSSVVPLMEVSAPFPARCSSLRIPGLAG